MHNIFTVSKLRAAVVSILCFIAALPFLSTRLSFLAAMFLGWSIIYGCIWFFKFYRDQQIIEQSKLEAEQEPKQLTNEMTSPGSSRLFVPQPLDRP